jgi:integrase/recombinase XerC
MKTLKEYFNNFLFYLEDVRGYSSSSIITYDNTLKELLLSSHYYKEDEKTILDITPLRFNNINNSKKTISKKLSTIRTFVKYMKEHQKIEITLLGDSVIKVPKTLPKPIEQSLIEEVLNSSNQTEELIISLLYGLGLRISELITLKVNDIQPQWIKVHGKGNQSRQIPLITSLYQKIEAYIATHRPAIYLFEKKGEKMNSSQIRYLFTKVFKKAGIKATPHQLRHSFATHLLHNGARIADVSELLGHRSMVSTQIYTGLNSSKKQNEYAKAHPLYIKNSITTGE